MVLVGYGRATIRPTMVRSDTGGAQWSSTVWKFPPAEIGMVTNFTSDVRTHTIMLADDSLSIYRSSDDGVYWTLSSHGLPSAYGSVEVDALLATQDGKTVYAGNGNPDGPGLYGSVNDGRTWTVDS